MKVLHVGEYAKGGIATYINNLLEFQKDNNKIEDVFLAVSHYNSEKTFNLDKEKIYRYEYTRDIRNIAMGIFRINKIIKDIKPDIIHAHSTFAGLMVRTLFIFKKKKIKIIYCPHGWAFIMDVSEWKKKIFSWIEIFLSYKTDCIINISNFEREIAGNYGIPNEKMTIIKSGISPTIISNEIVDITMNKEKINLLFIGRFDRAKGLDILLNVMRKNKFNKIDVYIIGESVLGDNDIDIPSNVKTLGWIENNQIDSYIEKFDALIIPSRWEGFGLVALEGMKNNKAIISSTKAALPELVEDGVNGIHIDIESEKNMIEVLNSLDKETLRLMGYKGYEIFKKNFTSEMMNNKIIDLYINSLNPNWENQ